MELDMERLAGLAGLKLTGEEAEAYQRQITAMVQMAEALPPLPVEEEPCLGDGEHLPVVDTAALRADAVEESLPREEVLHNAPQVENGQFAVPKMLG